MIRKIVFLALLIVIASLSYNSSDARKAAGPACTGNNALGVDANGYTIMPTTHTMGSSAVGKTYYVSQNDGTDATAVANDVTKPWKTLAAAITKMKSDAGGNFSTTDSWLLLKKGDVFQDQVIANSFNSISGIDCLHPMVIGSYDRAQPGVINPYGSVAVSSISCTAGTATVTTASPHGWSQGTVLNVGPVITLTRELPAGFNGQFASTITGASTFTFTVPSCPAASDTVHGIAALNRPTLAANSTQNVCGPNDGGNGSNYLIFTGIKCYGYTYDPGNAAWNKTSYLNTLYMYGTASRLTWNLLEDNESNYLSYLTVGASPQNNPGYWTGNTLVMRRNVSSKSAGSYFGGWRHLTLYQNYSFYDGWNPDLAAGQSVSIATGNPGVITWVNNPLISGVTNCSGIKFTGGTLPPEIVSGTQYYVTGSSGDTFNIATSCSGSAMSLSGSPSGVIGYWQGTPSLGYAGIYPQTGNCGGGCVHSYYIQNANSNQNGTYNITFSGNVIGFSGGSAVQGGGVAYENLMFQNWAPFVSGKAGELPDINTYSPYTTSYNGIFELTNYFNAPVLSTIAVPTGLSLGGRFGTYTANNNLIAYSVSGPAAANSIGIFPNDIGYYGAVSVVKDNVMCGIATPLQPVQGQPVAYDTIVGGSGVPEVTTTSSYNSPFTPPGQGGIPATGGSGSGLGLDILVNGTTGAVSSVGVRGGVYMPGYNYKVGDIISSANTYIGAAGSGWSARVSSVNFIGNVTAFDTIIGGSNYSANAAYNITGGTGTNGKVIATPGPHGCGASCSFQAVYGYQGYGYTVGDIVSIQATHVVQPTARVAAVINNTLSGNTFKAADCNNLQNATGSGGTGQPNSVPPPLTPSPTPPTDVIGSYFQSLAYGYQITVPTMLSGTTSGYEQGYMHQAALQQKSNWDENLSAHSVLNWARPQFGMTNP